MRNIILYQGQTFMIQRWGGGIAYALHHLPSGKSAFMQGDDAITFESLLEAAEVVFPHFTADQLGNHLWSDCEYCLAATEAAEA